MEAVKAHVISEDSDAQMCRLIRVFAGCTAQVLTLVLSCADSFFFLFTYIKNIYCKPVTAQYVTSKDLIQLCIICLDSIAQIRYCFSTREDRYFSNFSKKTYFMGTH